ncbi:transglutaminase family protein [Sporolactobacillus spathodeae]|uniref:Transglutaminase-like putative cysteine protease n=1 Tax=Sporolactobacillus spathodeae TaxID=1465502 RepID=A0ABS2QCY5_9BACL|nr:transglutaminase family protein [Sporolactobacillus spathodeae]MBM7658797.1 transglutaminase-like putative cysteine protease [Sporolactobacillus spathodeae]
MKFNISHLTKYKYASEIADSVNEIRLTPRTNTHQTCLQSRITTSPQAPIYTYEDYFKNLVYSFSVADPHTLLTIHSESIVVTSNEEPVIKSVLTGAQELEELASERFLDDYAEYLHPSEYTPITPDISQMASQFEASHTFASLADKLTALTAQIKNDFTYDPSATQVQTKIDEMIQLRRGVCQDFAHLMIALCRTMGIPARYVSGYQYITDINGGNADFEQASHAWVEAYIPGVGWTGFDPTNNVPINWRYIILAYGRDYKDIVPVKGIYHGTPQQKLDVIVDVRQIN